MLAIATDITELQKDVIDSDLDMRLPIFYPH